VNSKIYTDDTRILGGSIMFNFDFYNPTRNLFGKDKLESIDKYVPPEATVLITYGGETP